MKRCTELRELDISGCERVDEEVGLHVAQCLRYLEVLRAGHCRGLTDAAVLEIALRTRRHHHGPVGRLAPPAADGRRGEFLHDEPSLHLVNIVLKHQARPRARLRRPDRAGPAITDRQGGSP